MAYDDPPTPAHPSRAPQGQRCPGCGHLEPDLWARFCGVCGATLGPGGPAAGAVAGPVAGATVQLPHANVEPPVRYVPAAPPAEQYAAVPIGPSDRPQPIVYTVPSVGYLGPARIGAAVSAAFTLLPCVLFAFFGAWLVHAGRDLVQSWQNASVRVPVPVVSVDLNMNFVDLLHLRNVFNILIYWDDRLWLAFAILWLTPWVIWIVAGALFGVLLAAVYNLIGKLGGGVKMTLVPTANPAAGPGMAPTGWAPGPPPGSSAGWPPPPPERRR